MRPVLGGKQFQTYLQNSTQDDKMKVQVKLKLSNGFTAKGWGDGNYKISLYKCMLNILKSSVPQMISFIRNYKMLVVIPHE